MQAGIEQNAVTPVSATAVRSALERMTASSPFRRSPQLQRFLSFVVEETLSDRADGLKEYAIGVEVFARPPDFDPSLDSLVRVEARRLRAAIKDYYIGEGRLDPILIELPKGSYHPVFSRRSIEEAGAESALNPAKKWGWIVAGFAALVLVVPASIYELEQRSHSSNPQVQTIVVLPLQNLSSAPDNENVCLDLMDEITTELAREKGLRVIARTSAQRFRPGDDIAEIARQLRVTAILEGSVTSSNGHVRVTTQLINAADKLHIWAETYERSSNDLFQFEHEVARTVAEAVAFRLGARNGNTLSRAEYHPDSEAGEMYRTASYFRTQHGREGLKRSAAELERAIQKDPQFALAYATLSEVYAGLAYESNGNPATAEYMTRCRTVATKAIELDPYQPQPYAALGVVQYFYDWDPAAAEKSFRRSLELDASHAQTHVLYALTLVPQRRFSEAYVQVELARELDPLSNLASNYEAIAAFCSRDYVRAIRSARQVLSIDPNFASAHGMLGMAYAEQGKLNDAIREYETGLRIRPGHSFTTGRLGYAYAKAGKTTQASALLETMLAKRADGVISDIHIAYIYWGFGDRDRTFQYLNSAYQRRDPDLPYIAVDPFWDSLRNDPAFAQLAANLAQPASPR